MRIRALLGTIVFLFLAPGTVAGLVPWWTSRWIIEPPLLGFGPFRFAGVLFIGAGAVVLLDSFGRFALQGLGTPAPIAPTSRLVVSGLYRYLRNPMYVAVLAAVLGQGLLFGNLALLRYAGLLWIAFHLFVVAYEEPTLRATYGAEYDAFTAAVPRWIPRLRPWRK